MAPVTISSSTSIAPTTPQDIKKPMRPLTAYHIFFQLEREYLIQTTAGPDADKTIHDNKSLIAGVPRRYRSIKLLPDWYAGPGKRQKRKHRKSHGKIGFLELSQIISKRWATLESSDPETKQYVSQIAARELGEYKLEMKEYKAQMAAVISTVQPETPIVNKQQDVQEVVATTEEQANIVDQFNFPEVQQSAMLISPSSSPSPTPFFDHQEEQQQPTSSYYGFNTPASNYSSYSTMMMPPPSQQQMPMFCQPVSSQQDFCMPTMEQMHQALQPQDAVASQQVEEKPIDYSICRKDKSGHYFPSSRRASISATCDPLFELETPKIVKKRCVSPTSLNLDVDSETDFWDQLLTL
jgi:hypothetical protein